MKIPELLAPAGSAEKARIAFFYGADAVYGGLPAFSLRTRENFFDEKKLAAAVDFAKKIGKKFYVVVNGFPHEFALPALKKHLQFLQKISPHAIILADVGVLNLAKKFCPRVPLHISVQSTTVNSAAVNFWEQCGASRIILAREVSIDEAAKIQKNSQLETEIFVHGAMCMAYSGRCMISNFLAGRDANRGSCAHSCRWNFKIFDENARKKNPIFFAEKKIFWQKIAEKILKKIFEQKNKKEFLKKNLEKFLKIDEKKIKKIADFCAKNFSKKEGSGADFFKNEKNFDEKKLREFLQNKKINEKKIAEILKFCAEKIFKNLDFKNEKNGENSRKNLNKNFDQKKIFEQKICAEKFKKNLAEFLAENLEIENFRAAEKNFLLEEKLRAGEFFPIEEDAHGTHILSSRDLCGAEFLPEICATKIDSIKIEGRNKTAFYLATVVRAYRAALDFLKTKKNFSPEFLQKISAEFAATKNRGFFSGFLKKNSTNFSQQFEKNETAATHEFIGFSEKWEKNFLEIVPKNKLKIGDEIECVFPNFCDDFSFKIEKIFFGKKEVSVAHGGDNREKVRIFCPKFLPPKILLRRKI